MLFAEMSAGLGCGLFVVFVIGLIGGGIQLWLMVKHPQVWAQMSRQRHESLMAWQQRRHEKQLEEQAARRDRNGRVFGVAGSLLRLFLRQH